MWDEEEMEYLNYWVEVGIANTRAEKGNAMTKEELIEEASRLGKEIYGLDPNDFDPERVSSGCLNKADVLEAVLAMGDKYGLDDRRSVWDLLPKDDKKET